MALSAAEKEVVIKKHRLAELDTGSPEVQVALLTVRITRLTEHFKANNKDQHSRRGMFKLVSRRRKLLDYVKKRDPLRYAKIIEGLGIRK